MKKTHLSVVKDWVRTDNPLSLQFIKNDLRRSGLVPEDLLVEPVEYINFAGIPAYVIHYSNTGYWRVRLNLPPELEKLKGKYRGPKKEDMPVRVYLPHRLLPAAIRKSNIKYITEGEKKAEKMFKELEVPVMGIAGCWSWSSRSDNNGHVLLPSIQELLKPEDTVYYLADRDILNPLKLDIGKAAKALQMKLASLNIACHVLLPPDPWKGVDDWLTECDAPCALDDLEEFAFSWFPVQTLIDEGVSFKADKDGNVTSYKQAYSDVKNSCVMADLILRGDPFLSSDKYLGYQMEGKALSGQDAGIALEKAVNAFFPGFTPKKDGIIYSLSQHVKSMQHTNIIADYIRTLKWDGKKRLESWLMGAVQLSSFEVSSDKNYANKVGKALMCGLYQRSTSPGSQCDYMWILHGPQGIGKTTFFRTLGKFPGHDGYMAIAANDLTRSDYTIGKIIKQAVVLDIDDLESVRGKAHGDIKSFISRTKDTWRELYMSFITEEPRGCVITGSTNDAAMLTDLTGSRRFLILSVDDIRGVKGFNSWSLALRDMLLAECHARWAELADSWWDIEIQSINKHNREYVVSMPLMETIKDMHDNGLLYEYRGLKLVTPSAIVAYLNDAKFNSPLSVGHALSRLVDNPALGIWLGKRMMITVDHETMPRQLRQLYRTPMDVKRVWFYPVNLEE